MPSDRLMSRKRFTIREDTSKNPEIPPMSRLRMIANSSYNIAILGAQSRETDPVRQIALHPIAADAIHAQPTRATLPTLATIAFSVSLGRMAVNVFLSHGW